RHAPHSLRDSVGEFHAKPPREKQKPEGNARKLCRVREYGDHAECRGNSAVWGSTGAIFGPRYRLTSTGAMSGPPLPNDQIARVSCSFFLARSSTLPMNLSVAFWMV